MRMALVHDYLCGIGGSERVFQYLCEEFPEADIYTLAYNPKTTLPYFSSRKIHTTWLDPFVQNSKAFRWSFPISTYVMNALDLSAYDLVLSSSATTAKYVKPKGMHICYCYIPTRALWHNKEYFKKDFKRYLIHPFLQALRKMDYKNAQKISHFIAISENSKAYIQQYYNRTASEVIYSPIETTKFFPSKNKGDHYLLVSRLEAWKKVEYAIEAFNELGKPLRIIGGGSLEKQLRAKAKNNIEFLGEVDDSALAKEYSLAKAIIFTPFLEYGLVPLEANASGTAVIAYGKGGIEETMIPNRTAVFFYEQTAESLMRAVTHFETLSFDANFLVNHASKWNVPTFKRKIRDFLKMVTSSDVC